MKYYLLALSFFLFSPVRVLALDAGDITSFIYSKQTSISKEIKNTTDSGRLINIRIEKISSPLEGSRIIPMGFPGEVLLTPSSVLLPSKSTDQVRFFYKGPNDDVERYYRIVWLDQALGDEKKSDSSRVAIATASARIGTILVVEPRKVKYGYTYADGKYTNTGNASLNILASGPCLKKTKNKTEICQENYFLLPGKERRFTLVNTALKEAHVAMWQGEQFVSVK